MPRDRGRRVVAVMIASVDGRTAIDHSSAGLGHPRDTALLRELRARADVVLVGAATLVAEGYMDMIDGVHRQSREARGLSPHPIVATISRQLDIPDVPIAHEDVPFVIYSEQRPGAPVPGFHSPGRRQVPGAPMPDNSPGEVRVLESVTVEAVLADLGDVTVLCEGGPKLLRALTASRLLDAVALTISPMVTGGSAAGLIAGEVLAEPLHFDLAEVARADDHLFLHYRRGD